MANQLSGAVIDMLWPGLVAAGGVDITYERDFSDPVPIVAVKGRRASRLLLTEGIGTSLDNDFVLKKTDLAAFGEPKPNDIIRWTDLEGNPRIFEVKLDPAGRQWSPVDQYGVLFRVHTQEVAA